MREPSVSVRLDGHYRAIIAVLSQVSPVLAKQSIFAADAAMLIERRQEMARLLMEYALFKHRDIFEPAIFAGGERAKEARRLKIACIVAGEDFRSYTRAAAAAGPLEDWRGYRLRATAQAASLRAHVVAERVSILQLLGRQERISPKAPRAEVHTPVML
jgi:hypothetical protein